jgi:hypothetical protein
MSGRPVLVDSRSQDPRSIKIKHIDHSDFADFPRLKGHYHGRHHIALLDTDKSSLSTRFHDHMRNRKAQKNLGHNSEKKSGRSHRMSGHRDESN